MKTSTLNPQPSNLVLAGPMGAGKTSVARRVAAHLGRPWLDMDAELERRSGQSVAAIFAGQGEAAFRRAEAVLCAELARPRGWVVAGGGTVVDPANRAALAAGGVLICLTATPAALLARLSAAEQATRPLLRGPDPAAALTALLAARATAYAAIPLQVDTTDRTLDEVVTAVLALYETTPANPTQTI